MNLKLCLAFLLLLSINISFAQSNIDLQKVREKQLKIQNQPANLDFKRMEDELQKIEKRIPFYLWNFSLSRL